MKAPAARSAMPYNPSPLESACRDLWVWSDTACDIPRPAEVDAPVSEFEVIRPGHCSFSRWRMALFATPTPDYQGHRSPTSRKRTGFSAPGCRSGWWRPIRRNGDCYGSVRSWASS
jgi:hypothetical protein